MIISGIREATCRAKSRYRYKLWLVICCTRCINLMKALVWLMNFNAFSSMEKVAVINIIGDRIRIRPASRFTGEGSLISKTISDIVTVDVSVTGCPMAFTCIVLSTRYAPD